MFEHSKKIGVIGAGSFGMAIANLLAEKNQVLLFARTPEKLLKLEADKANKNQAIHENIFFFRRPRQKAKEVEAKRR